MSDKQDDTRDFVGIRREDASSPNDNVSHPGDNELQDLIEQDTTLYENHFGNEGHKDQRNETNKNVSKEESEILLEQEKGTNEEHRNDEMEVFLQRKKSMDDAQKTNELAIPTEVSSDEQSPDEQSPEPNNATSDKIIEESGKDSEENANLSIKNETSGITTDSWRTDSAVSSTEDEIKILEELNSSGSVTDEVQVSENLTIAESSTDKEIQIVEDLTDYKDKQNLNSASDAISSVEAIESKEEHILVLFERNMAKEYDKVSQITQATDGTAEELFLNSDNSNILAVMHDETSIEDSPEDSIVSQSKQVPEVTDEQDSKFGNESKVSEMVNAGTNTDDSGEEAKVSQSTQVSEGTVDEENSSTRNYSTVVENPESTEASNEDTSDGEISNYRESPPKEGLTASEKVTEIISRRLNSEEFNKKLNEINEMVKQLTAVEFISPNLSPEDREALQELYGQQGPDDIDWETHSELSESNATKRKSKESPEFDEDEQLQAISKKCKISKDLGSSECWACLEEQFRLASEQSQEDNDGQTQREKVYKFPVTESGEYREKRYKICKHQIAQLDAMVVSAMSMENYLSQVNDEMDNNEMSMEDFGGNEFSSRNSTFIDPQSNVPKSGSSSVRMRKLSKKNVASHQSLFRNKGKISQPQEQLAGVEKNPKGNGYFGICEACNTIKNLILFFSFTGSLTIAITVAKIFGVNFPVPKSQRNLQNDSKSSLQEFPDVHLDES